MRHPEIAPDRIHVRRAAAVPSVWRGASPQDAQEDAVMAICRDDIEAVSWSVTNVEL